MFIIINNTQPREVSVVQAWKVEIILKFFVVLRCARQVKALIIFMLTEVITVFVF